MRSGLHGWVSRLSTAKPASDVAEAQISQIVADASHAIEALVTEITEIRTRVIAFNTELHEQHTAVQQQREEQELLRALDDDGATTERDSERVTITELESYFVSKLRDLDRLDRALADFSSVLTLARRGMDTGGSLPDSASANSLAIRMAELRAREEERQRFARDVHDGPAQAFANAIIGLEFVERALKSGRDTTIEDSLSEIDRIKSTMREGLTEIRRFIFDNRPTMLRDRGLAATVLHYVQTYQSIFPTVVTVEVSDAVSRLDSERELAAFRVVQESIQNACKHARPSQVHVSINETPDGGVLVQVEDDGRGFDPDRVSAHAMGGSGLEGMKERAALLGARFHVASQRGKGTTITLEFPAQEGLSSLAR